MKIENNMIKSRQEREAGFWKWAIAASSAAVGASPWKKGRRPWTRFSASLRPSAMRLKTQIHPFLPGRIFKPSHTQSHLIKANQSKKKFLISLGAHPSFCATWISPSPPSRLRRKLLRNLILLQRGEFHGERLHMEREKLAFRRERLNEEREAEFWQWIEKKENRDKILNLLLTPEQKTEEIARRKEEKKRKISLALGIH